MWAVSVPTVQGYTPEPSDLEQLIDIDSKIGLLLPVEEFHSVHSSYTNVTMSQVSQCSRVVRAIGFILYTRPRRSHPRSPVVGNIIVQVQRLCLMFPSNFPHFLVQSIL